MNRETLNFVMNALAVDYGHNIVISSVQAHGQSLIVLFSRTYQDSLPASAKENIVVTQHRVAIFQIDESIQYKTHDCIADSTRS